MRSLHAVVLAGFFVAACGGVASSGSSASGAGAGGSTGSTASASGGAGGGAASGAGGGVATGTGGGSTSAGEGSGGGDPFGAPPVCTSRMYWTQGNLGSLKMTPGQPCIACHVSMDVGLADTAAGTVYATGHEPDDCNGAALDGPSIDTASIELVDANGAVVTVPVDAVGNFLTQANFALPYMTKVLYDGRERAAQTPHLSGDCNLCHTQYGAQGAPGRVVLP